jgi:hypothetical protein
VTLVVLLVTRYRLMYDDWRGYLVAFFSLVFVANAYMNLYARLRVDITGTKKEIEAKEHEIESTRKDIEAKELEIRRLDAELSEAGIAPPKRGSDGSNGKSDAA